jgi:hypothetical protein
VNGIQWLSNEFTSYDIDLFPSKMRPFAGPVAKISYVAEPGLAAANAAGAKFLHAHINPIEQIYHFTARTVVGDGCISR